jgi:hypothetical protein
MQPYFNPTRRNMEDVLNIFENGRQLTIFLKEDNLIFLLKMEDEPKQNNATKKQSKNNNIFGNGGRSQFVFENGRRPPKKQCNFKQLKVKTMIVAPLRVT